MKKIIWIVVMVALIVLVALFSKKADSQEYSIGIIVPLSGGAANIGSPFAKGVQMAVDEINLNGGIRGKKVLLGIEDGEFSGVKSVSAAQKLLRDINPDVFDVLFALPAQAVGPLLASENKPFLEWDYSRDVINNNELAFKTGFDARVGCENFVKYAKEGGLYRKLGVLMSRTPYNQNCYEGIKEAESNVSEYWYEFGSDDFRTILTKVNNEGVDMVVTIPIDPEPIKIFKQINDLKYPINLMCFTSSECIYPAVNEVASDIALEGTLGLDFIPKDLFESKFAVNFIKKYPEESSQTAITWAAQGYDDALIMTGAMKNCEPKDVGCITQALNEIRNYGSPIGSNGFTNRVQNLTMRKQIYSGGKWVDMSN